MDLALRTIGYEGATPEDFVATLQAAGVEIIVDVRELPISRRKGFAKTALSESLETVGIQYIHLKGLGDPKEGRDAARAGDFGTFLKVYKKHLRSKAAQGDLERAIQLADAGGACLLCYERDYLQCHRKLVADRISDKLQIEVTHLGVRKGIAVDAKKDRTRKGSHPCQGVAARW